MDHREIFMIPPMSLDNFKIYQDKFPKKITQGIDLLNSELATDSDLENFKLYDTRTHRDIFNILLSMSDSLSTRKYFNTRGICCSTLVGAKGIGKTTSLQVFAKICRKIFDNIYTVYISFNNILSDGNRLQKSSLISILRTKLEECIGKPIPKGSQPLAERLIQYLEVNDINILVLVDEMDQLYKSELHSSLMSLHDLAYLGNQPSGRVSVLICGSSSMMEDLITANGDADLREEYPLLKNAPNLNATKFLTKRAYSSLPTDLRTVATIAGENYDDHPNIPWIRIIAFAAGGSARQITRALDDSAGVYGAIFRGLAPDEFLSGRNTLKNSHLQYLFQGIMDAIYKKNKVLMDNLFNKPEVTVNKIAHIDWEVQFQPLDYTLDVEKLWISLIRSKKIPTDSSGKLVLYILHLADRCWITMEGVTHNHPHKIYPFSLYHVANQRLGIDALETLDGNLMVAIQTHAADILFNPNLLREAVAVPMIANCGGCVIL